MLATTEGNRFAANQAGLTPAPCLQSVCAWSQTQLRLGAWLRTIRHAGLQNRKTAIGSDPSDVNKRFGVTLFALPVDYQAHHLLAFLKDETFFTKASRVDEICEEILRRGLSFTWRGTMRADQGARLDERLLAKSKRAGLAKVLVTDIDCARWLLDQKEERAR